MSREKKLKPMSNAEFRLMTWVMCIMDLFMGPFSNPKRIVKKIPLKEGMIVVDYACGPGRYTILAAEIVGPQGTVYAVDIQPLAIETVKRKATAKSLANVKAVLVESYDTGIPDSSADMVLLIDAIQGIKEYNVLFHEIHRLLKSDGLLFMDSGHLKTTEVKNMVEGTGLFTLIKLDGKNMLLSKK
jgi:ubiquinone/menaquinone biosynthesis C-methylase UbiE